MQRFRELLHRLRSQASPGHQQLMDATERFLDTGDPVVMKLVVPTNGSGLHAWFLFSLAQRLGRAADLNDYDRRLLLLLAECGHEDSVVSWIEASQKPVPDEAAFLRTLAELQQAGLSEDRLDYLMLRCAPRALDDQGNVAGVGKYLLELSDARLQRQLDGLCILHDRISRGLLQVFVTHAPQRADRVITAVRRALRDEEAFTLLIELFGNRFESIAAEFFLNNPDVFSLGEKLLWLNPERYSGELASRLPAYLAKHGLSYTGLLQWRLGPLAVQPFAQCLADGAPGSSDKETYELILKNIAQYGGALAKPALLEILEKSPAAAVRAGAVRLLLAMNDPALHATLENAIETGMAGEARDAARFAELAAQFAGGRLRERLWQDLAGKSKLRREAAAAALAAGDNNALERAAGMLADKSRDARGGAVQLLGKLKTAESIDVLLNWIPREEDEALRDEIGRALHQAGVGVDRIVRSLGPVDLEKLAEQAARIDRLPGDWLSEGDLPPLRGLDGQPLAAPLVRYLLHRQSRQKEPIIDPEAAPLYAMVDRRTSGDFAFKLLSAFIESGEGKPDTWALIVAGMLGDNRSITTLASKVRGWAQDFSQKQGEWGIEALAINGSDAALSSVESIASKFKDNPRRKFKVIGEVAQNALELAATRLGLSMQDLSDRIVPTMGFEPGRPRRIPAGKRTIEATIGLDFKLAMKDVDTGKRAVSIPKSAAPELVAEFKGLGKLLIEVAKSQAARLEKLMVCQHRWTAGRWRERFLQHPMLFPFAVRLVWGTFDDTGRLRQAFRALPDRSLTDASDEPIELSAEDAVVGIVHPLEMPADQLDVWRTHLSDYEIEAPFPQIDRPIARVTTVQRDLKKYEELNGTKINSLSFSGKSERSGWMRGAVGGGGTVASYRKRFDQAGIDAFITFDGVPLYMDPTAMTTIGTLLFLPIDTTPRDFEARLMRLGEVPPMVYSEAVSDMMRICGRTEAVVTEAKPEES